MSGSENESDQTIVINDLLSFIWCKMKFCSRERLLNCIEEYYSREAGCEALKTLLTALPSDVLNIHCNWKEKNPFVAIMNALEIPSQEELPIFVCKNLNNVPKLEVVKQEPTDQALENKKEFYREHQRIKAQLNEVFSSLYELKKQFISITEGTENNSNFGVAKKPHKDLSYLQHLIDEERDNEIEEMFCENEPSDVEDEIMEQRVNLIANRRQRASLRQMEKKPLKKEADPPPLEQKVIHIEKDGKTLIADASEFSTATSGGHDGQGERQIIVEKLLERDSKSFSHSSTFKCTSCNFRTRDEAVAESHVCDRKVFSPVNGQDSCRYLIVEHLFNEILGNFTMYKCSACFFYSNDERTAVKHVCNKASSKGGNITPKPNASQKENILQMPKVYECHNCGLTMKSRKDLQKHIDSHLEEGHRCPLCANRYHVEAWRDHVRSCPGNGETSVEDHYCEICDVFYADKRALSFHKAFHDPSRPFECIECKYRFYTQKTVEDHFRTHKRHANSRKCPFCAFRTSKPVKIADHIRCHTGDRPYKCPKCERSCPTYNSLKVHITSHAPTKDYVCEICDKRFRSQGKMTSHRKIHSMERPHKCPICGKGFKFGLQMALHHRMHLDIRNHACPLCPYKSRTAAILRGHMNTHSNTKPYKCGKCSFGANHKSYLNWHLKFYHASSQNDSETC